MKDWLRQHLGTALRAWLGTLEVVYEGSSGLTPDQQYVFGYHPHGLFPIGTYFKSTLACISRCILHQTLFMKNFAFALPVLLYKCCAKSKT